MTTTTPCAICGAQLNGTYRTAAFDRPVRVNVRTCAGRCFDAARNWGAVEVERYAGLRREAKRTAAKVGLDKTGRSVIQ